ncbi:probable methyltransferase At1g27930 [Vigna umbellata]|uniref:probable methyltransferase At1g27930 n=1 Tax=Vigna umbellata TaxID=87088 RepID=UPI001F5F6F70|nr:probable methyltransferase At1g27930 [Vigna umbellata]
MQAWIFRSSQPSHKKKYPSNPNSRLLTLLAATLATTLFLLFIFRHTLIDPNSLCIYTAKPLRLTNSESVIAAEFDDTPLTLVTILHYATALALPQQTKGEIRRTFDVLQSLAPCNFLVFGLGHDSLMWDSFNPRGTTLFLEEDPKWTLAALQRFPIIRAHTVRYQTRLSDAKTLLTSYKRDCGGTTSTGHPLKGDLRCVLALSNLPNDVYDRDWDVIMIDGPRGYFPAAPGRMAVIYSAAMMARGRRNSGVTHVFLHDVDREIEKHYAREFLCMKYRVGGIRKLWHFVIPPVVNATDISHGFC